MKYSEECIQQLEDFIGEMSAEPSNFWKHSSVHHVACFLGVCRDTIYEWCKKYPQFSDTYKKWQEKRDALFLELKNKNSAWIFLAKNWLGMKDVQQIDQRTEFKPVEVIIKNGAKPEKNE